MKRPRLALAAWRRRGDWSLRDALWLAACWEGAGSESDLDMAEKIVEAAASCGSLFCEHSGGECLWWQGWHDRRRAERAKGLDAEADRWELAVASKPAPGRLAA